MKLNLSLYLLITFLANLNAPATARAEIKTLYYSGIVRFTDLTGAKSQPRAPILLKKDILSERVVIETATMPDRSGAVTDLATTLQIRGNTVTSTASDGSLVGLGRVEGPGPDFTYLDMEFAMTSTGVKVKNKNYISPRQLIARKEISTAAGQPVLLWEAELELIDRGEYDRHYQAMHRVDPL